MVYSSVTCSITVWGGIFCYTERGQELQTLYKAIVRNLFGDMYENNHCIFKTNSILKLIDIYEQNVSIEMFKLSKLVQYPSLMNDLNLRSNNHFEETRNRDNLQ